MKRTRQETARGERGRKRGWVEWREGDGREEVEDRRKPGTSRFCYDQWQTGTQRAPFVSIQGRLLRWTLRGVPLSPGSPHPSSARRILRLPRFSDPGRRAVFSFCSCDLSPSLSSIPPLPLSSLCALNAMLIRLSSFLFAFNLI